MSFLLYPGREESFVNFKFFWKLPFGFICLDMSGFSSYAQDELSAALNDRSLKMSAETRQALVDFMYDVA